MLDGLNKAAADRFWNGLARPLAKTGLTPNQVTLLGLVLVLACCALYLEMRDPFWFGIGLAVSFMFDGLDGAVARLRGLSSKFGGYLDAVVDRYQEMAVYGAIAWVNGCWLLCFLAFSGSMLTSYNKARTAIEISIRNDNWPDLLERLERIIILCAALILDRFVPVLAFLGGRTLILGLAIIALFSHITSIQRFLRARALIRRSEG